MLSRCIFKSISRQIGCGYEGREESDVTEDQQVWLPPTSVGKTL